MKYLYTVFSIICIGLVFNSCSSKEESTESSQETTSPQNFDDFVEFDLQPYEINASLMVPEDERTLIKHQLDTYVWDLKKGKQTFITIHDWGGKNGFENYLKTLENHTEKVEFIEKDENFIVYTLTTGTSKVTYHTAAQHEIEGVNYLFESSRNGLSKDGVENAIISVKSVNPNYSPKLNS